MKFVGFNKEEVTVIKKHDSYSQGAHDHLLVSIGDNKVSMHIYLDQGKLVISPYRDSGKVAIRELC